MALDYRSEYQRYRRYYMYLGPIVKNPIFRAYFSVVMSIFTVAIFVAFAIRPTIATIFSLQRQIADKQEVNQRLDEKINSLSKLQMDYQAVEKDLPVIFAAVPEKPDVSQAIILIEKTATASGINLTTISIPRADYSEVQTATGAAVASISSQLIPVSLSLTGQFDNVKNFLEQITRLPRIVSHESADINKTTEDNTNLGEQSAVNIYFMP